MSPLEQFALQKVVNFQWGKYDISLTNSSLTMLGIMIMISGVLLKVTQQSRQNKEITQNVSSLYILMDALYTFVKKMVVENINSRAVMLTPFLFSLFIFVLVSNLWGMVPFQFTITSHISVTLTLSILVFVLGIILGIKNSPRYFFHHFIPQGVPAVVIPFIVIIEIISFLARPLSLAIRLFANMVAGHIMLKVFASFLDPLVNAEGCIKIVSVIPFIFCLVLTAFEILIAGIQAYIFLVISMVYLKDSYPHD